MTEQAWIDLISPDAVKAGEKFQYLPSVLIAQTCQETGYGQTDLSQPGIYNIVGMKKELLNDTWTSDYWHGDTYTKTTPEWYGGKKVYIKDVFRVYNSYFDGLSDYCQFMRDAKYSKGGSYKYRDLLGTKDPYTLIEGVRSRGYCTDPGYSTSIMAIIKKHNLTKFDKKEKEKGKSMKKVEKPYIIDRIAENRSQVPYHDANSHEYLAIHYLGVNGENPDLYGGGYGGHFYVSKSGQCYQAAKVTDKIWHVGRGGYEYIHPTARNYNTIGIECATYTKSGRNDDDETWFFTEATQEACAKLAAWIMNTYNIPMDHLLRHGDITTKNCPSPYKRDAGKGTNWTWAQFRAKVAEYLGDTDEASQDEDLTQTQRLIKQGQIHSINFTGHVIDTDGIRGKETIKNGIRCLQHAINADFPGRYNLEVDGIPGRYTQQALSEHYIKYGEKQFLVTAAEILALMHGVDPRGVEHPGKFGKGLKQALGREYITGLQLLDYIYK